MDTTKLAQMLTRIDGELYSRIRVCFFFFFNITIQFYTK